MRKRTAVIIGIVSFIAGIIVGVFSLCVIQELKVHLSPGFSIEADREKQQTSELPQENSIISSSDFIGEDKAREIALEKAGLSASEVVFDRTELDFDDGIYRYEVEFRQGNTEYDADIKADDGTIISWDIDRD